MCDSAWQDLGSVSRVSVSNSDYNTYQNFRKIKNGDNFEWQMHNSISDASVLGCRRNHKIVIMT